MLVGRQGEIAALAAVVGVALAGRASALVLVGEPGIGKTALLQDALARAAERGARTVHVAGVESEGAIPGAALSLLAARLDDVVPSLPAELADALVASTRGVMDERAPAATLALLAAATEGRPTVIAADDLQWWDTPSRRALLFADRRLANDPVAVLLAGRHEALADPVVATLRRLDVEPLAGDDARRLLGLRRPGIATAVADAIVRQLSGNPLALVETAGRISEPVAQGHEPLPDWLPVGRAVSARWAGDAQLLPDAARRALLIAACNDTGRADILRAALAVDVLRLDDLVAAEDQGLVVLGADGASFPAPLVRAGVLESAAPVARRRAHAALAEALRGRPERAALAAHLAAAAPGPDAAVAEQWASLARQLESDGALEAAARAWEHSFRLSPDPAVATRACLAGVDAAMRADLREQAESLTRQGLERAPSPRDRGLLLTRLGVTVAVSRDIPAGVAMLEEAVRLLDDAERAEALLELLSLRQFDMTADPAFEDVQRFGPLPESPRAQASYGSLLCAAGRWAEGVPLVGRSLATAELPASWSPLAADDWMNACISLGVAETALPLREATRRLISSDRPGAVVEGLQTHAIVAYYEGQWDNADDDIEEAAALLEALGRVDYYGAGMAGEIASRRGDAATLAEKTRQALEVFRRTGNDLWGSSEPGKWGYCHLANGDLKEAEDRLREVADLRPAVYLPYSDYADYEVALVELLARTGRPAEAGARARRLVEAWPGCPNRLGRGWVERVRAAVADDEAAEQHYRAEIDSLAPDVHAFAAAQARLNFGEWLRRRRRRADAIEELTAAETAFRAMRCHLWAARCRAELAAAGVDVARADRYDAAAALTAQERRVAETVAAGCSNAEAARRLFLSPKTIEVHLTHIYRKLGITRRSELTAALAGR